MTYIDTSDSKIVIFIQNNTDETLEVVNGTLVEMLIWKKKIMESFKSYPHFIFFELFTQMSRLNKYVFFDIVSFLFNALSSFSRALRILLKDYGLWFVGHFLHIFVHNIPRLRIWAIQRDDIRKLWNLIASKVFQHLETHNRQGFQ